MPRSMPGSMPEVAPEKVATEQRKVSVDVNVDVEQGVCATETNAGSAEVGESSSRRESPKRKRKACLGFLAHWFGAAQFEDCGRENEEVFGKKLSDNFRRPPKTWKARARDATATGVQQVVDGAAGARSIALNGITKARDATSTGVQQVVDGAAGAKSAALGAASFGLDKMMQLDDLCGQAPDVMLEALDDSMIGQMMAQTVSMDEDDTGGGMKWQSRPIFIVTQSLVALTLWLVFAISSPDQDGGFFNTKGGLDSFWPTQTDFLVHDDCQDHRFEAWRLLTYQFTHANFQHIASNVGLTLILGIALEGFHGHFPTMASFNFGVLCGALNHVVSNGHKRVIGMSGGCYALLGMHVGELLMNWGQNKYRFAKVILLVTLFLADLGSSYVTHTGSTSHSAHLGGLMAGLSIAIICGRNLKVHWYEKGFKVAAVVLTVASLVFAGIWLCHWAPRTVWDTTPWCYARQAVDEQTFGNLEWHCVRCYSQACIERWSAMQYIATVDPVSCPHWGYTEM